MSQCLTAKCFAGQRVVACAPSHIRQAIEDDADTIARLESQYQKEAQADRAATRAENKAKKQQEEAQTEKAKLTKASEKIQKEASVATEKAEKAEKRAADAKRKAQKALEAAVKATEKAAAAAKAKAEKIAKLKDYRLEMQEDTTSGESWSSDSENYVTAPSNPPTSDFPSSEASLSPSPKRYLPSHGSQLKKRKRGEQRLQQASADKITLPLYLSDEEENFPDSLTRRPFKKGILFYLYDKSVLILEQLITRSVKWKMLIAVFGARAVSSHFYLN